MVSQFENFQSDSSGAARIVPMPRWKRALDLTFCLFALPVLAICTLFVSLLMKLASPGPIFFKQERVGHGGRKFKLYKFRTMHVSAPTATHQAHFAELVKSNVPMQKMDGRDSRLIFGGWLLRASGLDELPQLINVMKGDMSMVGPRPCIPYEYDQYSTAQRERFSTVPGLTGLWQVSGKNRTTFDEMVRFDITYARSLSFGQDVRIMLMTAPALWTQIMDTRRSRTALTTPPMPLPAAPGGTTQPFVMSETRRTPPLQA